MSKQYAFLFPGQGSQFVGMGQFLAEHPIAKEVFQQANEALGFNLTKLMWEGPEDELKQTQNAQPAILTVEVAIGRILQSKGIQPTIMAGHSLGEYSCLVIGGSIPFVDAVRAVNKRGIYMQQAVPLGKGTMAAVLGLTDDSIVEKACKEISDQGFLVEPANYNCPGQLVISGTVEGVEKASMLLKERGAKRCLPLQVSAPFHCSMLKPAGLNLEKDLNNIRFKNLNMPYIANVDVASVTRGEDVKARLVEQVWSPVRWTQTMQKLVKSYPDIQPIEVGPGKTIAGLMKKVSETIKVLTTDTQENLNAICQ
ncbi:MAG: ACP S-malonyltransferase [Bdellovibrionota bacterium]